jgi:DNA-binding NarL/FixJ family response regulator
MISSGIINTECYRVIDVVITSDIRIYCEGLGQIIARAPDINVVDTAGDFESAIESIAAHSLDVILLDMTMVGSCNLATHIGRNYPAIKIVALAMSYDEGNIVKCAEAGIICYVPREASVDELIEAIIEAARGECYCPPKIAACLLKIVQKLATRAVSRQQTPISAEADARAQRSPGGRSPLTRREQQIAGLLAEGMSNKQIARNLCIEVSTVKNHVHNVLVKLEVKNRSQAGFCLLDRFKTGHLNPSI